MTLYVDGVTYEPYLVTDDWPIHSSQIDVQLTVGACWQGQWVESCHEIQTWVKWRGVDAIVHISILSTVDLFWVNMPVNEVSVLFSQH